MSAKPSHTNLFINNHWVEAVSGRRFSTVDPATEQVLHCVSRGYR